jgi:hypothetical protein
MDNPNVALLLLASLGACHHRREVEHMSVSIDRPPDVVYAFAAEPSNAPAWATGLAGTMKKEGDEWIADSPLGKVKVRFAEKNAYGVLDHDVTLPSGVTIHNPDEGDPQWARERGRVLALSPTRGLRREV